MRFLKLDLNNFRNISSASLSVDSEDIVLTGINGQGKTNLLEAIYMLCYGSSFRTVNLKECVKLGSNAFSVSGIFQDKEKEEIKLIYKDNKRHIYIDDKEIKDRKELIYRFPCIVFSHEDIEFIKGEPEMRRKFFDQMMSLYSPLYFDNLRNYRRILSQRNAAIKCEAGELVALYNERLAFYGLELMKERREAVDEFNKIFPSIFSDISQTEYELYISYRPSWAFDSLTDIVSELERTIDRDFKLSTTSSGIHRDRFMIMCQSGTFSSLGSTGQLRLCSLIMRISEAKYFYKKSGKKPILLVDDVLLELDPEKRGKVISYLNNYSQAFYTFLPFERYFENKKDALYYKVEKGEFINEDRSEDTL